MKSSNQLWIWKLQWLIHAQKYILYHCKKIYFIYQTSIKDHYAVAANKNKAFYLKKLSLTLNKPLGGRNQDTANLRASPGQMKKVGIRISPWVFHFACLKHLSNFNFKDCIYFFFLKIHILGKYIIKKPWGGEIKTLPIGWTDRP